MNIFLVWFGYFIGLVLVVFGILSFLYAHCNKKKTFKEIKEKKKEISENDVDEFVKDIELSGFRKSLLYNRQEMVQAIIVVLGGIAVMVLVFFNSISKPPQI